MCHVFLPSTELFVDRLYIIYFVGEIRRLCAIGQFVGYTGLDGLKTVEDITLHHDEFCNTINHYRVTELDEIDPAATALTASNSTILMSKVTDFPAGFVKKLRGERAGADTRAVGFHDAIYVTYFVGAYPQSGTCTGTDSI